MIQLLKVSKTFLFATRVLSYQPFEGIPDCGEGEFLGDEVQGVGVVGAVQPEVLRQRLPVTVSLGIQCLVGQERELGQPASGGHLGMDTVEQVSFQVGLVKEPHIRISQSEEFK